MRRVALIVGLLVAVALPASAATPPTYYFVRPDFRMCPSPMCGGAWVSRVNHATTRCLDGALQRACYVASLSRSGTGTGRRFGTGSGDVVLGRIEPGGIAGFPKLAKLVVDRLWLQAAEPARPAPVYRVVDLGIRCITAPCFMYRASRLETPRRVALSSLDLAPLNLPPETHDRALRQLSRGGLLVSGVVSTVPDEGPAGDGRVLTARQAWLPPTP
jgi:uncharacterized protein DUF6748